MNRLPEPPAELAAHSARVSDAITAAARSAGGLLSFGEFMRLALYAPGLGYYVSGTHKFGPTGDFTTAPETSPLFGQVIARQFLAVREALGESAEIVEYGAGSGALARAILTYLAEHDALPERYTIIEVSGELKMRQHAAVAEVSPAALACLQFADGPVANSVNGLIVANEVLDALPCERFRKTSAGVEQQHVVLTDDGLALRWHPAADELFAGVEALEAALGRHLPPGYEGEWVASLPAWLNTVAASLTRGVLLLSDYGAGREMLYAPERSEGTFLAHYRHHAHADPLVLPGGQDLTAWVDFSRTMEALDGAGLAYAGFTTQAQFLLAGGLLELLAAAPAEQQLALSAGVKSLTLPGEMGERFKFLGAVRDCSIDLPGFSGRDFGHHL